VQHAYSFYLEKIEEILSESKALLIQECSPEFKTHFKARRIRNKEHINILNGKAKEFLFVKESDTELKLLSIKEHPPAPYSISLYLSAVKNADLGESILQSTEAGADEIVLFKSEHSTWGKTKDFPMTRLNRILENALTQCARKFKPTLFEEKTELEEMLIKLKEATVFYCDEAFADNWQEAWKDPQIQEIASTKKIAIFIGPEGGWSASEKLLLEKYATAISLGPYILKVSTACVAALTLIGKWALERVNSKHG